MPESAPQHVLAGKVALVTGASRGIGRAIATKLARAGCDVAAVYHNAHDQARSLCAEVAVMGRRAMPIQSNVASPESVAELFGEFAGAFDRHDIVVSKATSGIFKTTLQIPLNQ